MVGATDAAAPTAAPTAALDAAAIDTGCWHACDVTRCLSRRTGFGMHKRSTGGSRCFFILPSARDTTTADAVGRATGCFFSATCLTLAWQPPAGSGEPYNVLEVRWG